MAGTSKKSTKKYNKAEVAVPKRRDAFYLLGGLLSLAIAIYNVRLSCIVSLYMGGRQSSAA